MQPASVYRLRVDTEVRTIGPDGEALVPPPTTVSPSTTKWFHFQTGDGPGLAVDLAVHRAGPLNNLATYVARTTPANGAKRHYYGYDLAVDFNEAYVPDMYTRDLRLRLRDRNGKLQGDDAGGFVETPFGVLPPYLLTWEAAREEGGCGDEAGPHLKVVSLRRDPPELRPLRMYTAELVAGEAAEPLYSFQFATSRYRDVAEHLRSGQVDEAQTVHQIATPAQLPADWLADHPNWKLDHQRCVDTLQSARDGLQDALTRNDYVAIPEWLTAAKAAASALHQSSVGVFNAMCMDTRLVDRPLPPALEFMPIPIGDTDDRLLLIESPEPLDWLRLDLACQQWLESDRAPVPAPLGGAGGVLDDMLIPRPVHVFWSDDQTRALLTLRDGWVTPGRYTFTFNYKGDRDLVAGQLTERGEAVDVSVTATIDIG